MAEGTKSSMQEGMTDRSAKGTDSSMTPKGGSVNESPTRDSVASTPKTLGPRTA